jgi:hypothetical protein
VLLVKKGQAPSRKEILDTCLKIFTAFHCKRKWMIQRIICPCGACQTVGNLTLKFIVHYGRVAEIKMGRFITYSGTEMIVAHRLLKNSIGNNEYVLITEKFVQQMPDVSNAADVEWHHLFDEYGSIGKVDYHFALLNEAKKKIPDPPAPDNNYRTDDTPYLEMAIAADFRDVYMAIMNIPGRTEWMPGLQKVEQDAPEVLLGTVHSCTFENYNAVISPLRMTLSDEGILYAEKCFIETMNLSLVYEFLFKNVNPETCTFAARFMNAGESAIPEKINLVFQEDLRKMAGRLKEHCEKMEESLFLQFRST